MRPVPSRVGLLAGWIAMLLGLSGCESCRRQIHFTPAGSDSAGVHSADSLRAMIRHAQELWETQDGGEEGARTSATILREDLQVHPDQPWVVRARTLLDSLGGVGAVEIRAESDTSLVLTAHTFRGMPRFEECATCPHVYLLHRFRWGARGFARIEDREVPSPYSSFVQFVLALGAGDNDAAALLVTDPALLEQARLFEFSALPKGMWRVAPATDESAGAIVFFRGQQEAYRVSFEPRGESWLISAIKPTTRSIE